MGKMKMKQEDFDALKEGIEKHMKESGKNLEDIKSYYDELGKSMERMRWDLFWDAFASDMGIRLYKYLKDSHIDTALRRITGTKKGE